MLGDPTPQRGVTVIYYKQLRCDTGHCMERDARKCMGHLIVLFACGPFFDLAGHRNHGREEGTLTDRGPAYFLRGLP